MTKADILATLEELRKKQAKIEETWSRLGDEKLYHFFVDIIPHALDAERSSLFILDPKRGNVWIKCGTGVKEAEINVPLDGSLVGEVISSGEYIIEHNMFERTGTHESIGAQVGYSTRNTIAVPVKSNNGQVIGAIQVINKKDRKKFTDKDRQTLEKLAVQIQLNIEHIYLRQELRVLGENIRKKIAAIESRVS